MTTTETTTLADLINQVCDSYDGALTYDEIERASAELAGLIIAHPDAVRFVAELVKPRFLSRRRQDTLRAERDARTPSVPVVPVSAPGPSAGRWKPRSDQAKDEAADARQLAFMDLPIAVRGDGPFAEVLWKNATRPMLLERAEWYARRILGLADSQAFIKEQLKVIDEANGDDEMTLGEAYQATGRM